MNEIQLRDLRIKERFMVDDKYLNGYARVCGIYATGVYLSLCRHANRDQWCFPSINLIAEELAISRDSVMKGVKELENHLIVGVIRPGKKLVNKYYLLDKQYWSKSEVAHSHITSLLQRLHLVADTDSKVSHTKVTNKGEISLKTDAEIRRWVQ